MKWERSVNLKQAAVDAVIDYKTSLQAALDAVDSNSNVPQSYIDASKTEIQNEWDALKSEMQTWLDNQPADLTPSS